MMIVENNHSYFNKIHICEIVDFDVDAGYIFTIYFYINNDRRGRLQEVKIRMADIEITSDITYLVKELMSIYLPVKILSYDAGIYNAYLYIEDVDRNMLKCDSMESIHVEVFGLRLSDFLVSQEVAVYKKA
jgi:hypothetical protein